MTNNFFKIKKTLLFIFYFFILFIRLLRNNKKINIKGNKRISNETVIMFSELKIGDKSIAIF